MHLNLKTINSKFVIKVGTGTCHVSYKLYTGYHIMDRYVYSSITTCMYLQVTLKWKASWSVKGAIVKVNVF